MKQIGIAEKTMGELIGGDYIFYIDPKEPTTIKELLVREISQMETNKGWVKIAYYQSTQALDMGAVTETVPTRLLIVEAKAKRFISLSTPPSIYFTNKRALEKFMGPEYKG